MQVTSSNTTMDLSSPLTVGVIGCGPAGLFFLRQVEKERERLLLLKQKEETSYAIDDQLESLPKVTVFEKESRCGGLWYSKLQGKKDDSEGMYDGMWINAPKEHFEFEDYTFDEHFKQPMPAYLTRQQVFGYLEGATGDVIDKYTIYSENHDHGSIVFDTEVSFVDFDKETELFSVSTVPSGTLLNGQIEYNPKDVTTHKFDKVIVATGANSVPYIPEKEYKILTSESIPFEKKIIHSSQVKSLRGADILGKHILLIGSSFSAEDLALNFIKRGASHIYVAARSEYGAIAYHESWPMDKLTVLMRTEVKKVLENNRLRMGRQNIVSPVIQKIVDQFYAKHWDGHLYNGNSEFVLEGINVIVFCTGFSPYIGDEILADSLKQHHLFELDVDEDYWPNIYDPEIFDPDNGKVLPSETEENSKGSPIHANNGMLRADPQARPHEYYSYNHFGTYNNQLINNPGIFFHAEQFEVPLFDIDIHSAFILKVMLGKISSPITKEDMIWARSKELAENLRHHISYRLDADYDFAEAFLLKSYEEEGFRKDCMYSDAYSWFKLLSRAKAAGHPAGNMLMKVEDLDNYKGVQADGNFIFHDEVSLEGKHWTFSKQGLQLVQMFKDSELDRVSMKEGTNETFRDYLPGSLRSIHTGTRPRRFSSLWLEVDDLLGDVLGDSN